MKEKQDTQLLQDYVNGDLNAFETLYNRHKGGTYRFFLRQSDSENAEDLMQELWKKVVVSASHFDANAKFSTWLYKMARNLLIDRYRHLSVVEKIVVTDSSESPNHSAGSLENITPDSMSRQPEQRHGDLLQKQALIQCMQKLPVSQKESFLLRHEGGFSHVEIAQIVGASVEATKSRVKTAVKNLKDCVSAFLTQEVA